MGQIQERVVSKDLVDFSTKLLVSCAVEQYSELGEFYQKLFVYKLKNKEQSLYMADLTQGIVSTAKLLAKSDIFRKKFGVPEPKASQDPEDHYMGIATGMLVNVLSIYLQQKECEWYTMAAESWVAKSKDPLTPENIQKIQAAGVKSLDDRFEALAVLNVRDTKPSSGLMEIYTIIKDSEGQFVSINKMSTDKWGGTDATAIEGRMANMLSREHDFSKGFSEAEASKLVESLFNVTEVPFNVHR